MKPLSGHTQPFAVLGHPIGHTLSPVMHNAALQALGMDAIYLAFDVAPDRLLEILESMRAMGFCGVNLTVPLKEVAFRGFGNLDAGARLLGADRVELYTEPYARAFTQGTAPNVLPQFAAAARAAQAAGLGVNAGHDLNQPNLPPFLSAVPNVLEVSIGHALIADALDNGLAQTVRDYLAAIARAGSVA